VLKPRSFACAALLAKKWSIWGMRRLSLAGYDALTLANEAARGCASPFVFAPLSDVRGEGGRSPSPHLLATPGFRHSLSSLRLIHRSA
jgi:hypothetical protein